MKIWRKIVFGFCGLLGIAALVLGYSIYRHVTHTIPDCYAQWAAAEMVLGYREAKDEMPKQWSDLEPFYSVSSPHHGGLSFEGIRSRIRIDFPALPKLALSYASQSAIPNVIETVSGSRAYWDGAEPNRLVNDEIHRRVELEQSPTAATTTGADATQAPHQP